MVSGVDGPWAGVNSSSGSSTASKGTDPGEKTLAWFQGHPEARAAATSDPEPVPDAVARYVDWLEALPWSRMFAACPMALDGPWIDHYLRRFTGYGVRQAITRMTPSSSVAACAIEALRRL